MVPGWGPHLPNVPDKSFTVLPRALESGLAKQLLITQMSGKKKVPRTALCKAALQPPFTAPALPLPDTPRSEQEARDVLQQPPIIQQLPVSSGRCEELTSPRGTCPWRELCFHLCFYRRVWVKSSPSVVFDVIFGCGGFFFPLYNATAMGKNGRGGRMLCGSSWGTT